MRKPGKTHYHYDLGALAHGLDARQAAAEYKKEIAATGYYKAYYNLGVLLFDKGNLNEALPCFQRALRRKPDLAAAHDYVGQIYEAIGRTRRALRSKKKAVALCPQDPDFLNNLGTTYEALGKPNEARRMYRQALRHDGSCLNALSNLGRLLADDRRSAAEGIRLLKRAARRRPRDAQILASLALGYAHLGKPPVARRLIRRATKLRTCEEVVREAAWRVQQLCE